MNKFLKLRKGLTSGEKEFRANKDKRSFHGALFYACLVLNHVGSNPTLSGFSFSFQESLFYAGSRAKPYGIRTHGQKSMSSRIPIVLRK